MTAEPIVDAVPTLRPFYVTYGLGGNLAHCYSVVRAVDYAKARSEVDRVTGGRFAFMYDEQQFAGQVERYGLRKVPLQPQTLEE